MKARRLGKASRLFPSDVGGSLGEVYFPVSRALAALAKLPSDDAQTCVTTACMDLLEQWQNSGPPGHLRNPFAYVLKTAKNVLRRKPRKDERLLEYRAPVSDGPSRPAFDPSGSEKEPSEKALLREELDRRLNDWQQLPLRQRGVLMMNCQGFSLGETARTMKVSASYARSLKHKGLVLLRRFFQMEGTILGCISALRLPRESEL